MAASHSSRHAGRPLRARHPAVLPPGGSATYASGGSAAYASGGSAAHASGAATSFAAVAALLIAGAATVIAAWAPTAEAQSFAAPPGIELSAESFSYDGGTSRVVFRGLKISQNDLSIAADHATVDSLDFKRSSWQLRGDVRISVGTAAIASDEALLAVRNDELATVELRGDPATFEDSAPTHAEAVEGHANKLFFDSTQRTLTLTEDAWLRIGANEITSCDLIFDLDAETFSSGTTDCGKGGVQINVKPPASPSNRQGSDPSQ